VLEIHPHDAEQRGIREGDLVKLASRSGETALRATITERVAPAWSTRPSTTRHAGQCDHHRFLRLGHQLPGIQGDGGAGVAVQRPDRAWQQDYEAQATQARRILPAAE
jgi:formate dehydrogenase major subunit